MTEQPQDPGSSASSPGPLGAQPAAASKPVDYTTAPRAQSLTDRPEVLIGATFAGGLVLASILKRLAK